MARIRRVAVEMGDNLRLNSVCILKPKLKDLLQTRCGVWGEMARGFCPRLPEELSCPQLGGETLEGPGLEARSAAVRWTRALVMGVWVQQTRPDSRYTVHFLWETLWAVIGLVKAAISTQCLWRVPPHLILPFSCELNCIGFHLQFCP